MEVGKGKKQGAESKKSQKSANKAQFATKDIYIAKGPLASIQQSLIYTPRVELCKFNQSLSRLMSRKIKDNSLRSGRRFRQDGGVDGVGWSSGWLDGRVGGAGWWNGRLVGLRLAASSSSRHA